MTEVCAPNRPLTLHLHSRPLRCPHPAQPESRAMAHSIQNSHSRRAEQWLTTSSTCNGSLHPAHAKLESRAMARSIQHMQSRRAEQWLTTSSTCNGSLHPEQPQPESRAMAHSIQHSHSRRAEQWLTPSSTWILRMCSLAVRHGRTRLHLISNKV